MKSFVRRYAWIACMAVAIATSQLLNVGSSKAFGDAVRSGPTQLLQNRSYSFEIMN